MVRNDRFDDQLRNCPARTTAGRICQLVENVIASSAGAPRQHRDPGPNRTSNNHKRWRGSGAGKASVDGCSFLSTASCPIRGGSSCRGKRCSGRMKSGRRKRSRELATGGAVQSSSRSRALFFRRAHPTTAATMRTTGRGGIGMPAPPRNAAISRTATNGSSAARTMTPMLPKPGPSPDLTENTRPGTVPFFLDRTPHRPFHEIAAHGLEQHSARDGPPDGSCAG